MGTLSSRIQNSNGKDPDDMWSNQFRERETNVIYRWAAPKGAGELIKLYERDGEEGVLLFAEDKMRPMLYGDGTDGPLLITKNEYLKWKKTTTLETEKNATVPIDFDHSFPEHHALWKLNKRGVDGENLVHLLLSRDHQAYHEVARILLKAYPGLANDLYLGDEFFGQSCLHLAIVKDDYETAQLLLECGADVNVRATGTFFQPETWKRSSKNTDYSGWAYYGEFPLAFAACFGNKDMYDLLIDAGADPNSRDSFGNTILHMCVISNSSSMYSYAVRHWKTPADPHVVNDAGYTALTLATKLGRKEIFQQMLELSKIEFWRFADMACSAYPLNTLDTIRYDGSTDYDSALMTVINGTTPEHLDMIENEVIQRLLADKWNEFARSRLYIRMGILFVHLLSISVAIILRPIDIVRLHYYDVMEHTADGQHFDGVDHEDLQTVDWFRLVFELSAYALTVYYFTQQMKEVTVQGFHSYRRNMMTTPAKFIYTLANFVFLLCLPCRLLLLNETEEALLCFAVPGAFIYCLFFARTFKLTGPFVQMIYSMIAGDFAKFLIISAIFLTPFAFVMHFLGANINSKQDIPSGNKFNCPYDGYFIFTYQSLFETAVTLFRASMKSYDYEELACANYAVFAKIIFVIYMFIMPIMMISIIIAMMGNTYKTVIAKAEKAWKRQYALIIMNMERSMNAESLKEHMQNYSIKLQDGKSDSRGLLVVRKTIKTRTCARLDASRNWTRITKQVVQIVSQVGMKAARDMLHGFELVEDLLEEVDRHNMAHKHSPVHQNNRRVSAVFEMATIPSVATNDSQPQIRVAMATHLRPDASYHRQEVKLEQMLPTAPAQTHHWPNIPRIRTPTKK